MKLKYICLILALFTQTLAHATALVYKDDVNHVMHFISEMNYVGPDLTPKIALESSQEISRMWNESHPKVLYKGEWYAVYFEISYTMNRNIFTTYTGSCAQNFISVEKMKYVGQRSDYDEIGGYTGTFYTSDDLGHSTTTAHEYGHGLGLIHNPENQRNAAVPGIMFPRGTMVRDEFQWDPQACPGAAGGTLNPAYRKVRLEDITSLHVSKLVFNEQGYACMGKRGNPYPIATGKPINPHEVASTLMSPLEMLNKLFRDAAQGMADFEH